MTEAMNELSQELCVEEARRDEILRRAVRDRVPVVISRFNYEGWSCFHSRFVEALRGEELLVFEAARGEDGRAAETLRTGERIGVSFKRGRTKCLLTSTVASGEFADPTSGTASRLALRWPDQLQVMQRRLYERVPPPAGTPVSVRVWPCDWTPNPDPMASPRRPWSGEWTGVDGDLENLSAGGIGVHVRDETLWRTGDTLRCGFTPLGGPDQMHLDIRLRHIVPHADGGYSLGFQFLGLDSSTTGHCRLAQLASVVSQYRRASVALSD